MKGSKTTMVCQLIQGGILMCLAMLFSACGGSQPDAAEPAPTTEEFQPDQAAAAAAEPEPESQPEPAVTETTEEPEPEAEEAEEEESTLPVADQIKEAKSTLKEP